MGCDPEIGREPCCAECGTALNNPEHQKLQWANAMVAQEATQDMLLDAALFAHAYFAPDSAGRVPSPLSPVSKWVGLLRDALPFMADSPPNEAMRMPRYSSTLGQVLSVNPPQGNRLHAPSCVEGMCSDEGGGGKPPIVAEPEDPALRSPRGGTGTDEEPCCCVAKDIVIGIETDSIGGGETVSVDLMLGKGKENNLGCKVTWEEISTDSYHVDDAGVAIPPLMWVDLTDTKEFREDVGKEALEGLASPCGMPIETIEDNPSGHHPRTLIIRVTLTSGCDSHPITKYAVIEYFIARVIHEDGQEEDVIKAKGYVRDEDSLYAAMYKYYTKAKL